MKAATTKPSHEQTSVMKNGRRARNIALIVASACCFASNTLQGADPPPGLLRKIAQREADNARARANYMYRQTVTVEEFDDFGKVTGQFREVREVTFSPNRIRYEQVVERPRNTLIRLKLTEEDFADIRNVQPFLLTPEEVPLYEGKYKGEETIDGIACFVESIRPRQILSKQRYFEGTMWVRQSDLAVIRSEGRAVPQIETLSEQNLFPHFTTIRREMDGKWLFPVQTYADDTLFFREKPQRIRITIRYLDYRQFQAGSTITYGEEQKQGQPPKK
jgi:hypothetical protein